VHPFSLSVMLHAALDRACSNNGHTIATLFLSVPIHMNEDAFLDFPAQTPSGLVHSIDPKILPFLHQIISPPSRIDRLFVKVYQQLRSSSDASGALPVTPRSRADWTADRVLQF
jgi:hypothetical protein